ncbi:MAG: peptidoglycan-binding protein [Defluviitaleaceae bacterium]|nr:peptidoglycan-binding protein [Defluviitaleaceae bacterium]
MSTYPGWYLQMGSLGEHVRQVQRCLNNVVSANPSISKLAEDGDFGPKTFEAVRAFQRDYNLKVDGIVGPITWDQLMKECNSGIHAFNHGFIPLPQNFSHNTEPMQAEPMQSLPQNSEPMQAEPMQHLHQDIFQNSEFMQAEPMQHAEFMPGSASSEFLYDSSSYSSTNENFNSINMLKFLVLGSVFRSSTFTNK